MSEVFDILYKIIMIICLIRISISLEIIEKFGMKGYK